MTTIEQQVLETWFINHRTNLILLNALNDELLAMTTSLRGGGSVGHQLAHMYNVRFWKLEKCDKLIVDGLAQASKINKKDTADYPILGLHKKHSHVRNKVKPFLTSISTY